MNMSINHKSNNLPPISNKKEISDAVAQTEIIQNKASSAEKRRKNEQLLAAQQQRENAHNVAIDNPKLRVPIPFLPLATQEKRQHLADVKNLRENADLFSGNFRYSHFLPVSMCLMLMASKNRTMASDDIAAQETLINADKNVLKSRTMLPIENIAAILAKGASLKSVKDEIDDTEILSDWELYENLLSTITDINNEYTEVFKNASEKYAEFSKELTGLLSSLSDYVSSSGEKVEVRIEKLVNDLKNILVKYSGESGVLYPQPLKNEDGSSIPIQGTADKAACEAWAEKMGTGAVLVTYNTIPPTYAVKIDCSPIDKVIDLLNEKAGSNATITITTIEWNTLQEGISQRRNDVQTAQQIFSNAFSSGLSMAETIYKVLREFINSALEAASAVFKSL